MTVTDFLFGLTLLILLPLFLKVGYIFICMLLAAFPTFGKTSGPQKQKLRFAFLIPAHNEDSVVGDCVASIRSQNYPSDLIDVFVVADNCKDKTAEVARNAGATVFERFTTEISGKAKAVKHGIEQICSAAVEYDYLVIVDADNMMAPNWAEVVSETINPGDDGFQTYVETKNPNDSSVTFGNYLSFVFMNKVIQAARSKMGLPALLAGTGMGFSHHFINQKGFSSDSLTEDRDLSIQALFHGYRFRWIGNAYLYDEKPVGTRASFNQYKRWSSGQLTGLAADLKKLLRLLFGGKLIKALDVAYSVVGPVLPFSYVLAIGLGLISLILGNVYPISLFFALACISVLQLALILLIFGRGFRDVVKLGSYIYVRLINWGSLFSALINRDTKWVKTKHDRKVSPEELERVRSGKF